MNKHKTTFNDFEGEVIDDTLMNDPLKGQEKKGANCCQ